MKTIIEVINERLKLNADSKIKNKKSFYFDNAKVGDTIYLVYCSYRGCSDKSYEYELTGIQEKEVRKQATYEVQIEDNSSNYFIVYFQKVLIDNPKYYWVLGESGELIAYAIFFDTKEKSEEFIKNYQSKYKKDYNEMMEYLYNYGIDGIKNRNK